MAAAEDEALSGTCGVLACSPEIYKQMVIQRAHETRDWLRASLQRKPMVITVPDEIMDQLKND